MLGGFLRGIHFYRKVPHDLTEATLTGGTISLASSLIMAYLFMPLGPLAAVKKCSPGQQKWCVTPRRQKNAITRTLHTMMLTISQSYRYRYRYRCRDAGVSAPS